MTSCGRAALLALLLAGATPAAAAPVELLSHRAAYRLSLADGIGSDSSLLAVRGALVMEWRASCEGWLSTQQMGFVAEAAEGPGFSYDVRLSSWESPDNTRLRFNVRTFEGGRPEAYRGQAALESLGGSGTAQYVEPEPSELELPAGTLFPSEHIRRLITAARSGQSVVTHEVFDGSGPDALARITAVIGKAREVADDGSGTSRTRWPVTLAYYEIDDTSDATPEFELDFLLGDDGVLRDVVLKYGEFTLRADLDKLETFERPVCE
ncbi:MAG: DUF1849 family protein [Geminicoccaceae bacterium]